MIKLLKIELQKLKPYTIFWLFNGMYAVLLFGAYYLMKKFTESPEFPDGFPLNWQRLTWIAGFLNPFLVLIVILFTTNEYTFNTFRQNVIDGLSRTEVFMSKVIVHFIISLYSTILVVLLGTLFSALFSKAFTPENYFHDFYYIGIHFLKCFTFLSIAYALSLLFKKGIITIIMLIILYIGDGIVSGVTSNEAFDLLPFASMSNLIASPDFAMFFGTISIDKSVIIAVVIAYLVLFNVGSWFLLNKRDMKG
jgi:ABC-type transport system involved in multi-copper enzyme maturation permease subunit